MRTPIRFAVALALTGALVTACSGAATPTPAPSPSPAASIAASPEASPSPAAVSPSPAPSPSPSPNACAPANLATLAAGKLTIGTDNPAYPPYFQPPASGNATKPWQLGDPTNGQGFEAAFAYALRETRRYPRRDELSLARDRRERLQTWGRPLHPRELRDLDDSTHPV